MMNFIRNNLKAISIFLVVILLGTIGITFAYTRNNINVVLNTGEYQVIYGGQSTLPTVGLTPIEDSTLLSNEDKAIKIAFNVKGAQSNSTKKNIIYDISLTNLKIPVELRSKYLKWRLYEIKNNNKVLLSEGSLSDDFDIKQDNRLLLTNTQKDLPKYSSNPDSYIFYMWISEPCIGNITECTKDDDLTPLMNKSLSGKISIEVSTGTKKQLNRITGAAKGTLIKLGLESSLKTDTPDFSKTSCSSGCEENTVGIYKAKDDLGDSYYFRGDVENNYVKFAGFYWRIVRINGDGTIRLIYDGTSAHPNGEESTDRRIGTSAFNSVDDDPKYVGYMYDNYTKSSTIKGAVDNWYKINIEDKGYSSNVADTIYCNDTSLDLSYSNTETNIRYGAYNRINVQNGKGVILTCLQNKDKYTLSKGTIKDGNEKLIYPVGLITADEMIMAGYPKYGSGRKNKKLYLYTGSLNWSMSPVRFIAGSALLLPANSDVNENFEARRIGSVRPVISLKQDFINSGTGTMDEPFTYSESKATIKRLGLESSLKTDTPDFSKTSCSSGCEENTVGIYKAPDDLGDSYYFRGDVENNYVKFGKYDEDVYNIYNYDTMTSTYSNLSSCPSGGNCTKIASAGDDMYWRIVRINGDGTIRLIYDGTSAHPNGEESTDRQIGSSVFNSNSNDPKYSGYMYDANTSSTIKGVVDNWYKTNILDNGYSSSVADAIYCNDMSLDPDYNNTETDKQYGAHDRIVDKNGKGAILTCPQKEDKYTVVKGTILDGNGKLIHPVGLITMDEMIMAGYKWTGENTKLYLYTGSSYWSASPAYFGYGNADVFYVDSFVDGNDVHRGGVVRVSVSLNSTAIKSGSGTAKDPFVV